LKSRITAIILLLVLAASLPALAETTSNLQSGVFTYSLLPDGTAQIEGVNTPLEGVLTIPDHFDGYPVSSIGTGALTTTECYMLTEIIIPEGVINIGDGAFVYDELLTSITLPNSLTTIGANPFPCNTKLNIIIPDNHPIFYMQDRALFSRPDKRIICYLYSEDTPDAVYDIPVGTEIIGDEAFYMNFVAGITIPDTVVRIGNNAFTGCDFENIVIPDSVASIGDQAFSFTGCENVSIPGSVTEIGTNPFADCDRLTKIKIAKNHPYLGMKDGVLFSKPDRRLITFPGGKEMEEYHVPEGTEIIGDYAFYQCEIERVILPNTVMTIGDEAFGGGCGPKCVIVPSSVISIGQDAFEHGNLSDEDYDCTVILETGSFAETYCQDNNVSYRDENGSFHQRKATESVNDSVSFQNRSAE